MCERIPLRHILSCAGRAALSFVFPDACLACGVTLSRDERHLCGACRSQLVAVSGVTRVPPAAPIDRVHYALRFEGPAGALVRALKYDARTSVARELASMALPLARELTSTDTDALVPVPLHSVRRRERGFNQSALLARLLSDALGIPVLEALVRTRATPSQTGLAGAARVRNVDGAFRGRQDLRGLRLLLVDDVVTTGATLTAASVAALACGAEGLAAMATAGRSTERWAEARAAASAAPNEDARHSTPPGKAPLAPGRNGLTDR